ncbi:hypothetical protein [Rubrivivax gelatinosus]|uniref:hypothetical protein n=1 Tax=Rubrivivax gelatinosus TaxID=28068 RepID=UPI0002D34CC0|nr:hypothetical protein [Rubrivivax gelatinosus]MBG6078691.1 hypothetical protein [Rubrivivax gelatinosus]
MSTIQTFSSGAISTKKLGAPTPNTPASSMLRADLGAVADDITAGCLAGATITGPARTVTGGAQKVYVAGWFSAPGTLYVDTSADGGSTWNLSDSDTVTAGEHFHGIVSTQAGANRYRVRFVCGPAAASKAWASTQAR